MAPNGRLGNTEGLRNLLVFQPGEVAQLDNLGFLRRGRRQLFECFVNSQNGIVAIFRGEGDVLPVHFLQTAAVPNTGLFARPFDQNPPHGLGRGAKEVAATIPTLLASSSQPQPRFVNECRSLQCLLWRLTRHFCRRQFAEFLIDQGQQLLGGLGIALVHPVQNLRDVAHSSELKDGRADSEGES